MPRDHHERVRHELLRDYYGVRTAHWLTNNTNCSIPVGMDPSKVPFVTPKCRGEPYWCPLARVPSAHHSLDDAPPQLGGVLPCSLIISCDRLPHFMFHSPSKARKCLRTAAALSCSSCKTVGCCGVALVKQGPLFASCSAMDACHSQLIWS